MTTIRNEQTINLFGIEARAFAVVTAEDGRILNQTIKASRTFKERGKEMRIVVKLRFDDECRNGHEDFSITATLYEHMRDVAGGCLHDEIAKHFPELAHLIKWHLCGIDGPMHYVSNTVYHAGDRDHNGLRKDEVRQIRNGKTGQLAWIRQGTRTEYFDGDTCPTETLTVKWEPWSRIGEGKARDLDAARHTAVWPDATDAELCQEPDALKKSLLARLPSLLEAFKADMLACGFLWPTLAGRGQQ